MKSIFQLLAVLAVGGLVFTGWSCSKAKDSSAPPAVRSQVNNRPVPIPAPTTSSEIRGQPGQPQTVDVFSGKPVNRGVFEDQDGDRLFFCCEESRKIFLRAPQVNLQKIRERGIILEAAPRR